MMLKCMRKRRRKKPMMREVRFEDLDESYPSSLKNMVTAAEGAVLGTYNGQSLP